MSTLNTQLGVNFPKGFKSAGVYCGIKKPGLLDLALIVSDRLATVAGVFTTNQACAAPVRWSRKVVQGGQAWAIVANSGNANCLTGAQGERDAERMAQLVAQRLGCEPTQVAVASTGVIGVPLPMNAIEAGIAQLFERLSDGDDRATADAILTTDTFPKRASIEVSTPDGTVRIGAIAKGAGMIAPNMATMLAFITTDAEIPHAQLQPILARVVDATFNSITVDGDTSTNDSVIMLANGASGVRLSEASLGAFEEALYQVCEYLAKRIVRDGEGATKLFEVKVVGADSRESARKIARTIAESLLVKTAIHGGDPNWGRVIAAAGRAGVPIDVNQMALTMQGVRVFENGQPTQYDERDLIQRLQSDTVELLLELNQGDASATFWSSDLTAEYVKINAHYRT
ncbi:MAG: bifunctional glutamate N-acetyltransferase/amino-acid acetyltransferase ArgJ [Fimbriimonadales bacterium]|jgi:glutamate N-acetyltransferase/amino-acid N-acetyltransferase|nr:bifunctional glutamate N-acetyltransferase/amino-acid acetyltransferase ArgJ [Fimbriimonadales bacterium]GBC89570.1 Arginine biosynthesis bifunctional protein ArgJ [bacterium HR14]GIV13687.1 MAG: arginine biosynthesis bifunctional protein ArgJ [Fimbriimonadales bacterium]CUU02243.1 glutamate N-acetyltransferase [Armatimonadetes bacterium GBS]CUU35630.1 glutamate N-acetyltransferase [Armatimonadetes bacterium GXS]